MDHTLLLFLKWFIYLLAGLAAFRVILVLIRVGTKVLETEFQTIIDEAKKLMDQIRALFTDWRRLL